MPDYLIVRLISGVNNSFSTESYGYIEVRPPKADTPDERATLQASLAVNSEEANLDMSMRLAVVIEDAGNIDEAHLIAESYFEEVVDVLAEESYSSQRPRLLASGFARDYSTGALIPRRNERTLPGQWPPMSAYKVANGCCEPISLYQYIMAQRNNDLCARFIRSAHWSRKAEGESNLQLRILFNWFSLEALWKINVNDDIVPKAMLSIGFPVGKMPLRIDRAFLTSLENHPKYRDWKKIIHRWMESIRNFRNDTVHSGYRLWDVDKSDIRKYNYIVKVARGGSSRFVEKGISLGHVSSVDVWNHAPLILPQMNNILNYVHGTLIYGLESRQFEDRLNFL